MSYQENRKKEFRIRHSVIEEKGEKLLIKKADNPEGSEFLKKLPEKEIIAKKFIGNKAEVVMGQMRNEYIYYKHIGYPTLEELIAQSIRNGDRGFGASLVDEYIRFLHKLPSKKYLPREFINDFMIGESEVQEPIDCILVGLLDLIPCNILIGNRSWYIIDHEWTFQFPIPTDFVVYRGVVSLIEHLQKDIQQHVSKEEPVALFWGYGKNRTYIPWSWLKLLNGIEREARKYHRWEYMFQKKVLVSAFLGRLRLKDNPRPLYQIKGSSGLITNLIWIYKRMRSKIQKAHGVRA